jgi:hypothetical protein
MTQMNRAICSFANRIESEDSLAKEPTPTLVSPWAGSLGYCWAGLVMCGHPPPTRASLGCWAGLVTAGPFSFLSAFLIYFRNKLVNLIYNVVEVLKL